MFCSLLQEHLGFRFPGSFVEGDLQHLQLARKTRHRVHEQIKRIASSALGYSVSSFGGSDITKMAPFNDAGTFDLDPQRPIVNVVIISGWAIDGIE
jgi:hypothetical protein